MRGYRRDAYLCDVDPVSNHAVNGSGLSLGPLQVVGEVIPLQDTDGVGRVVVELHRKGASCTEQRSKIKGQKTRGLG